MKSLEEFDKEIAKKRARLEKDHALAHALPTTGRAVSWIGEGGWEPDGRTRKADVERTVEIAPHIIHSPFRGCEHVTYKAPDSLAGDKGEHISSPHRATFVHKYLCALLDAFEPYLIDMVAIKGRYASYVPESFDWENHKDYEDAEEVSRGLFEVEAACHVGPNSFSKADLAFYARTDATGPLRVSFDLNGYGYSGASFTVHKLYARPRYSISNPPENARPRAWDVVNPGAVHVWRRASADGGYSQGSYGYTLEWLFDSREALETAIGLKKEPQT